MFELVGLVSGEPLDIHVGLLDLVHGVTFKAQFEVNPGSFFKSLLESRRGEAKREVFGVECVDSVGFESGNKGFNHGSVVNFLGHYVLVFLRHYNLNIII